MYLQVPGLEHGLLHTLLRIGHNNLSFRIISGVLFFSWVRYASLNYKNLEEKAQNINRNYLKKTV
jgi:hypothetical protein